MKLGTIVVWSFIASLLISILGACLKITHSAGADIFLAIGVILTLVFIVSAIYEVRTSTQISSNEKTMWTIAFIFMAGFTGLIYFLIGRRRIVESL